MNDTCPAEDARIILPDLIEQVRALGRPVVLTAEDGEPVAALVPPTWLDDRPAGPAAGTAEQAEACRLPLNAQHASL